MHVSSLGFSSSCIPCSYLWLIFVFLVKITLKILYLSIEYENDILSLSSISDNLIYTYLNLSNMLFWNKILIHVVW